MLVIYLSLLLCFMVKNVDSRRPHLKTNDLTASLYDIISNEFMTNKTCLREPPCINTFTILRFLLDRVDLCSNYLLSITQIIERETRDIEKYVEANNLTKLLNL